MPIIRISASGAETLPAYLSTPLRESGHGVVVIQEIFGVNEGLRATVDALAQHGYIALAPDLFWRLAPDPALSGHSAEDGSRLRQQLDWPMAIADLESCVAYLRSLPGCDGKVATVGYCMGGRLAFMMALAGSSDCDVSFHGVGLDALVDGAPGLRHPVQVHIGTADHLVPPESRDKITSTLARHRLAEVHVYEGAEHGFARPESRHFDPDASALGMTRMFDFFRKTLDAQR